TYFNGLVGGVAGADGRFDTDHWPNTYREALRWVNEQAARRPREVVTVAVAGDGYITRGSRPTWRPTCGRRSYQPRPLRRHCPAPSISTSRPSAGGSIAATRRPPSSTPSGGPAPSSPSSRDRGGHDGSAARPQR